MRFTLLALLLLVAPLTHALQVTGPLTQGGFAFGRVDAGTKVTFDGQNIPLTSDGWFGIGFHRNHPPEATLTAISPNGKTEKLTLLITPRTFPVQHIKGVPQKTVTPNKTQNTTAASDSQKIKAARAKITNQPYFLSQFSKPAQGRTSGVYGSRRTYNGKERSWHKGLDIAAPTGTPIYAPAQGSVTFAADTFYNGNLIILDHGNQFFTIYAHLNSMAVNVGDTVTHRQKIGEIGSTGRSTGPHLHWGFYWQNTALDPKLLLSATTETTP